MCMNISPNCKQQNIGEGEVVIHISVKSKTFNIYIFRYLKILTTNSRI